MASGLEARWRDLARGLPEASAKTDAEHALQFRFRIPQATRRRNSKNYPGWTSLGVFRATELALLQSLLEFLMLCDVNESYDHAFDLVIHSSIRTKSDIIPVAVSSFDFAFDGDEVGQHRSRIFG